MQGNAGRLDLKAVDHHDFFKPLRWTVRTGFCGIA
ncbi:hypothetical protein AF72_00025 [Xylella taiwanensis]|uniref:Uncharacterized protein n=1 Tax=Xylella taiwanensis TaxID=1444770 RepID=Z9JNS9_9GAMM|nr:hypothetical protein AF72_00025 [Xylella taiwanensis]